MKRIHSSTDTSIDKIDDLTSQLRIRPVPDDIKEDQPKQLTPFLSTATAMATTSTGTHTIEDSELLAQQIEQQQRAATATALSGTGGRGNMPPQGGGRGGPPTGGRGEGNPTGGGGGGGNPARGGGGGGNPPGGGGQPPNQGQQNPPPNPTDGKILRVTPLAFTG